MLLYVPVDEPFGLVPIEALARRVAVVVSNHGGPSETVVDGKTGLQVDPFSTDAVAEAARTLIEDPALRARLAAAGERMVSERFGIDAFAARHESYFAV
jgi:glycosyltransferase involved in cell wall biosynthesis